MKGKLTWSDANGCWKYRDYAIVGWPGCYHIDDLCGGAWGTFSTLLGACLDIDERVMRAAEKLAAKKALEAQILAKVADVMKAEVVK